MSTAKKPTITLGVSGSIAAYKIPDLVSRLKKQDLNVQTAITKHGLEFVTKQALMVMSENQVITPESKTTTSGKPIHIEVADTTDLLLIAPATARMLGKLANGDVDNPISEIYTALPQDTPVLIAPAMNGRMLAHPSVQRNISQLLEDGVQFIQPAAGMLACGYEGLGKLAANHTIVNAVVRTLKDMSNVYE